MSKIHAVVDTCCIVKRYNAREQGRKLMQSLFARPRTVSIHVPNVCIPEVRYVFQKQRTTQGVPLSVVNDMRKAFTHDIEHYNIHVYHVGGRILTMTDELIRRAFRAGTGTRIQPIDCIVLAVALTLSRVMSGVVLVTSDRKLEVAAQREKLSVWNPLDISGIPRSLPYRRRA